MKVVIGIDSGSNGGACVLYPDKAAFATPIGSITEIRDILETAQKYAKAKSHTLDCFIEEVTGYIGGKPQAVPSSWASHTAQFSDCLSDWEFHSALFDRKSGRLGFLGFAGLNIPPASAG